jgi:SAM-dependent methyltransferase
VDFIDPEPGTAVVEVGAGSGRISFDGGLAERIGSRGQLLLTDPSGAQLLVARTHAAERGLHWVRFLRAPVEQLPLASGTADLVVGALFLHFTEPGYALQEMARLLRPGGRVAICAFRAFDWPQVYLDVLDPVRRELAALGLPLRTPFMEREELFALVGSAGLRVDRVAEAGPDTWECPSLDIAVAGWRQLSLVPRFPHISVRISPGFRRLRRRHLPRRVARGWRSGKGRLRSIAGASERNMWVAREPQPLGAAV